MMKTKIKTIKLLLLSLSIIILSTSCSSVFSATISGTVKTEPRNNSSAEEQQDLANANVYLFFDDTEWESYKSKWTDTSIAKARSLDSIIELPTMSDTIRTTTTNDTGGFSVKTMWITNSPLFGKDGDEKTFHFAVYHKDYGMFFDDSQYSVFSDSSQNISYICQYDEKLKTEYTIDMNLYDYSSNNSSIEISTVNPKVVITYKLITTDNEESEVGEITQIYEELPTTSNGTTSNSYTFITDKYYYDADTDAYTSEKVYPVGKIYFYDKGEEGEKSYRMCSEEGIDLSEEGTSFTLTDNSNILEKDIYVDSLNRDYRLSFNFEYPQNDENQDNSNAPSLETFSPKTTIKVYFDGYNQTSNSIDTPDSTINEDELYKTISYSVDEVPTNGYYTFNIKRMFDDDSNEIYPAVTYYLEDDVNDKEYEQTDIDGNLITEDNCLTKTISQYYIENYSTTVDAYVRTTNITYNLSFNLINIATNQYLTTNEVNPIITIKYNDGNSDITETFSEIPSDGKYVLEVERNGNTSTNISVDLQDKRNETRYRLCSNDPDNTDPTLQYTVGTSEEDRYEEEFELTKANDNELNLYIKDYQYQTSINIEGRYIVNDDETDNGHSLWLIPEINNGFDEEDAIKLAPTNSHYINETDTYNSSNIENGYFSTTYTQNRIADFDEYSTSSKYLTQDFKLIVNKVRNESNPVIGADDYMNNFTMNNNSSNSVYLYVDNSTTYN